MRIKMYVEINNVSVHDAACLLAWLHRCWSQRHTSPVILPTPVTSSVLLKVPSLALA